MKISAKKYARSLYELTRGKDSEEVNKVIADFVKLLAKDNQLKMSGDILSSFTDIYNKENSIVEAEVLSAEKIGSELEERLKKTIKEKYEAKEVVIKNKVNKGIKGGIIIKVGDDILDASISGQLEKMKAVLASQ